MNEKTFKILSLVATGVSLLATMVSTALSTKMTETKIEEEVQKALANSTSK